MSKHVEITEEEAAKLLSKKPSAKGKKRRTEIEHDHDLENKMTDKLVEKKRPKRESEADSRIGMGQVRGVMEATMCRVYEEFWPGMETEKDGKPDTEIAEEAYILGLTMLVGNNVDTPRKGLKMREAEMSDTSVLCRECAA